jgi:hypothetical protein
VGGGVTLKTYIKSGNKRSFRDAARLYSYLPEKDEWIEKIATRSYYFALAVYHSQLVIASGCEYLGPDKVGPHTNKVWTFTLSVKGDEKKWREEIPPMNVKRHSATSVSIGDHLVVAGGLGVNGVELKSVEVYNGHEWSPARELPRACWHMKCTLYKGCLYLMGGIGQGQKVYYIEIDHLIANCTAVSDLAPSLAELEEKSWKKITSIPHERSALASFGGSLVAIGGGDLFSPTSKMYAYAPGSAGNSPLQLWIPIASGNLPTSLISICAVTLPSGELMSIGGEIGQEWSDRVFKASLHKGKNNNVIVTIRSSIDAHGHSL